MANWLTDHVAAGGEQAAFPLVKWFPDYIFGAGGLFFQRSFAVGGAGCVDGGSHVLFVDLSALVPEIIRRW